MLFQALFGLTLATFTVTFTEAQISCYECDSSRNFTCTEFWDPSLVVIDRYLSDCSHVFEAQYCIKMAGIFDGKLGTKRFCSSKDWGNYCEYVKRPGDIQEYRSCVFTCSGNACNHSTSKRPVYGTLFASSILVWIAAVYLR